MFGRRRIRSILDSMLACYGSLQARSYDTENTIVISGSPRSGTTWLAEILNRSIPGTSILWEPLNLNRVPEARSSGLTWRTPIPPDRDWPEAEHFMRRVLTGQILNTHTVSHTHPVRILTTKSWIVKSVRATRLLAWISRRFPVRMLILLIRHPCAVVASQRSFPIWSDTREEALAEAWSQDYNVLLSSPRPHPWMLVPYEKLVMEGRAELKRVFHALDMEVPRTAVEHLRIPSATSRGRSAIRTGSNPLGAWKKNLTSDQVRRVLDVVSTYGLDFYSDHLEPDYERLNLEER